MLVHFINMKFNGDLREETFKILFLEIVPGFKYDTVIARSCSLLGPQCLKEGANKQVISSQADSLIKISRIWADFFPANTSNQPI